MLEAKKSFLIEKVFAVYNRNLLKRRFHSLSIFGLDVFREKSVCIPQIIYANHSSWWDGLIFLELLRRFNSENFIMMEEKQLRKLFLFRRLGAFSVARQNPREAIKSINYAARLLSENTNRTLIIFPQGEILPNDARPLRFYNGLAKVAGRIERCKIVPAAFRYEFLGNYKPEIFIRIDQPLIVERGSNFRPKNLTPMLEARLTALLENLKQDITSNNTVEYAKLF